MRLYRAMMVMAVCFSLTAYAGAIQKRSYRIEAMGEHLAGIVEDQYTDLVANPARITTAPSFMSAKIGENASPLSLGYIADNWGAIGEWTGNHNRDGASSTSLAVLNGVPRVSTTQEYDDITRTDSPTAKLMKSLKMFGQDWGLGLEYVGYFTAYADRNAYSRVFYNASGVPVQTELMADTYNDYSYQSSSFNLELGKYTKNDRGETDLVFGLAPYYSDTVQKSYSGDFVDRDPDGDGNDMDGNPIAPYTASSEYSSVSKSEPHINLQTSFEYRARRQEKENVSRAAVFGAYYWAYENRMKGTSSSFIHPSFGVDSIDSYSTEQRSKYDSAEVYARFGRSIRLTDRKLLLAYAAGADLYYSHGKQKTYLAGARASDIDTQTIETELYSSAGMEYTPVNRLALRFGVTPSVFLHQKDDKAVNYNNVLNGTANDESYSQSVQISGGIGFQPMDPLRIDAYVISDLFEMNEYNLMLQYLF